MVFFSTNTSEADRLMVASLLGVRRSNDIKKYLGLPNLVEKNKKSSFQNLKDRIKNKLMVGVLERCPREGKKSLSSLCYRQF